MRRVLLFASTTGYQTRMFGEAASRLGAVLMFATDRCDQLDDPWFDGAIPVRFHHEEASTDAVVEASRATPFDAVVAVGDRPAVIAARVAERLGLPGHPPDAAAAARDKAETRSRLRAAGLPTPWSETVSSTLRPEALPPPRSWPVVVKPAALSGSRGVMRANDQRELAGAYARLHRLLRTADVRALHDAVLDRIIVEEFIAGREYALEGVMIRGRLQVLAIFDKPDPLDGPFFEETIYVTPSRLEEPAQAAIRDAVAAATAALGLRHGPIHAECRVNTRGVFVLEVAARPIGGLCAASLAFEREPGERIGLEELLLRHALGEPIDGWRREAAASGVMMIPIPAAGVLRRVDGVAQAASVPRVRDVRITAKPDQRLVPVPEGASYLGFIFADGESPAAVEQALREGHSRLTFVIDRALPVVGA
jgi:biotin carboxylase